MPYNLTRIYEPARVTVAVEYFDDARASLERGNHGMPTDRPDYSERRSVTVPAWRPKDLKRRLFADPQRFLGSATFGAVVSCASAGTDDLDPAFVANRRVLASVDGCKILAAQR